jgi:transposase
MEGPTSGKGGGAQAGRSAPALDLKALHAKFGELTLENDFLEGALGKAAC